MEKGIFSEDEFLKIVKVVDREMKKRKRGDQLMMVCVVFCKDFERKRGDLMGMLAERRKDMTGQTRLASGTKWAWQAIGHLVKDKKDIFVFPKR